MSDEEKQQDDVEGEKKRLAATEEEATDDTQGHPWKLLGETEADVEGHRGKR